MRVRRVLLLLNRASGTGQAAEKVAKVQQTLFTVLPSQIEHTMELVDDHPAASASATRFLNASEAPAAVIVGGGGGTLRAVVEGICRGNNPLPGMDRIRLVPLRLGSGNVVAKKFGIVLDPEEAIRQMAEALQNDVTAPCCVIYCETEQKTFFAVTMAGLGQFGRVPGDLVRWHRRLGRLRKWMARLIPLEKLNDIEYLSAMLIRSIGCSLFPSIAETVEVASGKQRNGFRLFGGVCLNFRIPFIPFDPQVQIEEEAISLHLLPLQKRSDPLFALLAPARTSAGALHFRIERNDCVELRFSNREKVEFFLDEDPEFCSGRMKLRVAGTLAFVPGKEYSTAEIAENAEEK